jgi:dTDP-6-deoxy-L-talose 4-dehydrogenase (NAD+)
MKIAITGANGFVGRHVSATLENMNGIESLLCTRYDMPFTVKSRHLKLDIADADQTSYARLDRPDTLIHLAWGGLPNYGSNQHIEHELPKQINFLTHLIHSGLKRLIVTGTCYEYGLQSGELTENSPIAPITQYGMAKSMLHDALERLRQEHSFELVWLRLFYLYGDGQAKSSLYSQLEDAMASHKPVFNMSGGEQIRDFMPVEMAAERIVKISTMPEASGTFNVCSGNPVKVKDIVARWIAENDSSIKMNLGYYPYPASEPMAFWGSNTKIMTVLESISPTL